VDENEKIDINRLSKEEMAEFERLVDKIYGL
jgi:hypothetical protein